MATLLIHTNSASAHPHLSPFPDRQLAHLRITSHAHRSSSPSIAPSPHPNSTHSSLLELAALPTPPHHSPHPDLALRQTPLISLRRRKGVWQSQCRTELGEPGELGLQFWERIWGAGEMAMASMRVPALGDCTVAASLSSACTSATTIPPCRTHVCSDNSLFVTLRFVLGDRLWRPKS
jgi:hypothetical protein